MESSFGAKTSVFLSATVHFAALKNSETENTIFSCFLTFVLQKVKDLRKLTHHAKTNLSFLRR